MLIIIPGNADDTVVKFCRLFQVVALRQLTFPEMVCGSGQVTKLRIQHPMKCYGNEYSYRLLIFVYGLATRSNNL